MARDPGVDMDHPAVVDLGTAVVTRVTVVTAVEVVVVSVTAVREDMGTVPEGDMGALGTQEGMATLAPMIWGTLFRK